MASAAHLLQESFSVGARVCYRYERSVPGSVGTVIGPPRRHAFMETAVQPVVWDGCDGQAVLALVGFLRPY